jgi:hypothetical protein
VNAFLDVLADPIPPYCATAAAAGTARKAKRKAAMVLEYRHCRTQELDGKGDNCPDARDTRRSPWMCGALGSTYISLAVIMSGSVIPDCGDLHSGIHVRQLVDIESWY